MVIARLLTPADIGVFSITMVLLSFVSTVRDLGAGNYLVQERALTPDRVRAVWAIQLGLGLLLAVVVLVACIPVSLFYGEPRMREIMLVVAATYALNPFGSLTYAWQIREMRFDTLALVRFSATVAGAIISIYLAWRGIGPVSLAYGSLGATVVNALMAIYFRPKWFPWMPGFKEIRRVLAYGSQTTGAAIIHTIAGNAPELLLGKLQNMTITGLFSRASGLVGMFDRLVLVGVTTVALSWFSLESRKSGDISQPFIKATSYMTAIGGAFCFGMLCLTFPVMRMLYGIQWDGAIPLTRLLTVALLISLPAALCTTALMALGHVKRYLHGTAITMVVTVVAAAIGANQGLFAIGVCWILASLVQTAYWLWTSKKLINFTWNELTICLARSAVVALGAGISPLIVFIWYGPSPVAIIAPLIAGMSGSIAGFLIAVFVVQHPLHAELQNLFSSVTKKFQLWI